MFDSAVVEIDSQGEAVDAVSQGCWPVLAVGTVIYANYRSWQIMTVEFNSMDRKFTYYCHQYTNL